MKYIEINERGSGKSTRLLRYAIQHGCNIAVATKTSLKAYESIARTIGATQIDNAKYFLVVDGVYVAPFEFWVQMRGVSTEAKPLLVDDISGTLSVYLAGHSGMIGYTDSQPGPMLQYVGTDIKEDDYA